MKKLLLATNDMAVISAWRTAVMPDALTVDFAVSAGEALGRATAGQPGVIVLGPLETSSDVFIAQIREHPRTGHIPIVSLGTHAEDPAKVLMRVAPFLESTKVLIADDDRHMAGMLEAILAKRGFSLMVAYDGAEALRQIRQWQPQLILLDIMLPIMDGFHICQTLNEDHSLQVRPKVLIISGRNSEWDQNLGSACGAEGYLVKPFSHRDLFDAIDRILTEER